MDAQEAHRVICVAIDQLRAGLFPTAELDWFVMDCDEHIAVFMNAGHLTVPPSVLQDPQLLLDLSIAISKLYPEGELLPDDPKEYLRKGLYVYDWNGTDVHAKDSIYTRLSAPDSPITASVVPAYVKRDLAFFRFPHCFGVTSTVSALELTS